MKNPLEFVVGFVDRVADGLQQSAEKRSEQKSVAILYACFCAPLVVLVVVIVAVAPEVPPKPTPVVETSVEKAVEPSPPEAKEECFIKQQAAYTKFAAGGSGSLNEREVADLNLDCEPGLSPSMDVLFPERVAPRSGVGGLSRAQVLAARKNFRAELIYVDLVHDYAPPTEEFMTIHHIRVRVTNDSGVVLPFLTLRVNSRYNGETESVRSTSAVDHVVPGQTAVVDFYPRGSPPRYSKVSVEIEALPAGDDRFVLELRPARGADQERVEADVASEGDRQWEMNRFGAMKGDGQVTRSFKTPKGTVEVGMTLAQVRRVVDQRNVIGPRVRLAKDAYLETYQFGLKLYNVRFDDANVVRDIVSGVPDCGLNTCQPR